ncbi:MAG: hypothetical protein Q9159_004505 [Coniocarpon cinnabarinum]
MSRLNNFHLLPAPRENISWARYGRQVKFIWSDQMLVSCIALLSIAFAKRRTMSLYHFSVLTDLAWLAANAHLVTIPILLPTLRESNLQRWFRVLGMLAAFLLLLVTSVESANYYWNPDNFTCVAECVFLSEDPTFIIKGSALDWCVVNILLLLWDYITMSWLILSPQQGKVRIKLDSFFNAWIASIHGQGSYSSIGGHQLQNLQPAAASGATRGQPPAPSTALSPTRIRRCYIHAVRILQSFIHFLDSYAFQTLGEVAWLAVGLYWLKYDRSFAPEKENEWGDNAQIRAPNIGQVRLRRRRYSDL